MTVESPGGFNDFQETHPDIDRSEPIAAYTGSLIAYRAGLDPVENRIVSPDFILMQWENEAGQERVEVA